MFLWGQGALSGLPICVQVCAQIYMAFIMDSWLVGSSAFQSEGGYMCVLQSEGLKVVPQLYLVFSNPRQTPMTIRSGRPFSQSHAGDSSQIGYTLIVTSVTSDAAGIWVIHVVTWQFVISFIMGSVFILYSVQLGIWEILLLSSDFGILQCYFLPTYSSRYSNLFQKTNDYVQ